MDHLIDGLYIGDVNDAATAPDEFVRVSVMYIDEEGRSRNNFPILVPNPWPYKMGPIADMPMVEDACYFIQAQLREHHPVLLHCFYGMERSVLTAMRYLMLFHQMTYDQAWDYVKARHSIAVPHPEWWPDPLTSLSQKEKANERSMS